MGIEDAVDYGDEIMPGKWPGEISVEKQFPTEKPGGFESFGYNADLYTMFDGQKGENIFDDIVGKIEGITVISTINQVGSGAKNVREVVRLKKPPGSLLWWLNWQCYLATHLIL